MLPLKSAFDLDGQTTVQHAPLDLATAGVLTLYALHAHGGWTAHAHHTGRQQWAHDFHAYFSTKEEARAKAVELGEILHGAPLPFLQWAEVGK